MYNWQKYEYKVVRTNEKESTPIFVATPDLAADLFSDHAKELDHESFWVIPLDAQNGALGVQEVYRGTVGGMAVRAAEVLRSAILSNALSIITVHNHPSGSLKASENDLKMTKDLVRAARLLDIELLDHLVVNGKNEWLSIRSGDPELWHMEIPEWKCDTNALSADPVLESVVASAA